MTILGIDPGLDGAMAWLAKRPAGGFDLTIWDFPTFTVKVGKSLRRVISLYEMAATLPSMPADRAFIESVHAMPKQGVVSTFTFGEGFGTVKTAVAFLGIPQTLVEPSVWTRMVGLKSGATKDEHVRLAMSLFPEHTALFRGPRGGALDGRADAALIAYYGMKLSGF